MDIALIQKSIDDIAAIAKAGNVEITKELGVIREGREKDAARILALEQQLLTGKIGKGIPGGAGGVSVGDLIAKDAKIQALLRGDIQRATFDVPSRDARAAFSRRNKSLLVNQGTSGVSPEFSYTGIPELVPGGIFAGVQPRLTVLDVLRTIPISTASADVPKLVSDTANAGVQVHEGGAKNETAMTFENVPLKMITVAHFLNASKQVLGDNPLLSGFVENRLIYDTYKKFQSLIISGSGNPATDGISGLTTQGTEYIATADHESDVVGESIGSLISLGYNPDVVILNWFDFRKIVQARDANGRYIGPGWAAPTPNNLWGVTVISSAALTSGTGIVLDSNQVAVLEREAAAVQIGYTGSQFTSNEVTLLSECRGNLAVFDQHAVNVLTFGTDSP